MRSCSLWKGQANRPAQSHLAHSGIEKSPEDELRKAVEIVKILRARYDVPIGVSVYPTDTSSEELKEAGAIEIKYNVETIDPDIFVKYCPGSGRVATLYPSSSLLTTAPKRIIQYSA